MLQEVLGCRLAKLIDCLSPDYLCAADSLLRLRHVLDSNCRTVSQYRSLDTKATGSSPLGADRKEIDFQVDVNIPWNAPEAFVMLDRPGLFVLDTGHIPDVLGLRTRYPDAAPVKAMQGRAPESLDPGGSDPSTAYITSPLQCVSNGPITFCISFLYRPDTCSQYWAGNGPSQYGTGLVYPHTVLGQYRTGTIILYRFGTGPIIFHTGPVQ